MITDKFLTMKEAAEKLNISKATIYRMKDEDPSFPVVKFGGSLRIPETRLESWIYRQCSEKK